MACLWLDVCGQNNNVVSTTMLQVVARSDSDNVLEACLASTHQQPHARFCTTLGDGDDRYDPLTTSSHSSAQELHMDFSEAELQHLDCCKPVCQAVAMQLHVADHTLHALHLCTITCNACLHK